VRDGRRRDRPPPGGLEPVTARTLPCSRRSGLRAAGFAPSWNGTAERFVGEQVHCIHASTGSSLFAC